MYLQPARFRSSKGDPQRVGAACHDTVQTEPYPPCCRHGVLAYLPADQMLYLLSVDIVAEHPGRQTKRKIGDPILVLPCGLCKEPVLGFVAFTNREDEVVLWVQGGVSLPQAVLPVPVSIKAKHAVSKRSTLLMPLPRIFSSCKRHRLPVFVDEEPVDVLGVRIRDVELRCCPVRDTNLPQRRA